MYKEFFAILKKTGQNKEDVISAYTKDRTTSLRSMRKDEFDFMIKSLRGLVHDNKRDKRDAIRKAIIAQFYNMDYDQPAAAAKKWAEKMGVGRGDKNVKKGFNEYSEQELMKLLHKAKLAVRDYNDALRKRLKYQRND